MNRRVGVLLCIVLCLGVLIPSSAHGQEARRRWERMAQIRRDKFDYVLPEAMRENRIDMWKIGRAHV